MLKLYLANLPPEIQQESAEEQLQALFAPVGQISRIKVFENKNMQDVGGRALLWLETELGISDVLTQFNGHLLNGYRLCLSPTKPSVMPSELTAEQRQFAEALAEKLGETGVEPCQQIADIIQLCGTAFAQAVLDDTLVVEAQGGMPVRDGSRQRTRGGIFFYVARGRMSFGLQQVIVPHLRKKEGVQPEAKPRPAQGKKKGRASKSSVEAMPQAAPPPVVAPPSEEEMIVIRQNLIDLRCEHAAAQSDLEQLKAQPHDKQMGTFSAIKRVLDIQRQIDGLLKDYPFLKTG